MRQIARTRVAVSLAVSVAFAASIETTTKADNSDRVNLRSDVGPISLVTAQESGSEASAGTDDATGTLTGAGVQQIAAGQVISPVADRNGGLSAPLLRRAAESSARQRLKAIRQADLDDAFGESRKGPALIVNGKRRDDRESTHAGSAESKGPTPRRIVDAVLDADELSATRSSRRTKFDATKSGDQGRSETSRSQNGVLLTSLGPALTQETTGPRTIVIGKNAVYKVTMANQGDVAANAVVVNVSIPGWTEVAGNQASAGVARFEKNVDQNSIIQWKIRQLPARGRETLTIDLVPRDSRPFDLEVAWTFAPSSSTAQIEVQEPKLHMVLAGPPEVLYGDTKVYTITLSNPGTGDADNVVLNLLPLTPNQEVAGARELGTLKAGERKSIEIELTAHQAGRLQVRASAFADGGLRAEATRDVIVRRANLEVAAVGPPMMYSGTEASYKIRVANTGDATAQDVVATAVLPVGAKYGSSTDGGKLDSNQGQVQWQIGSLRPGAVRVFDLQCVLTTAGDNRLDIRSQASGDLSAARSVLTAVEALADLKLSINDPRGAVAVGTEAEYEVRIINRGSKAAENVQIVGYFSEGVEPITITGWRGQILTGEVRFESIPQLDAGQELVFKITARADRPGNHVFRTEVECASPETRLASEEWTKYYGDQAATPRIANQAASQQPIPAQRLDVRR